MQETSCIKIGVPTTSDRIYILCERFALGALSAKNFLSMIHLQVESLGFLLAFRVTADGRC